MFIKKWQLIFLYIGRLDWGAGHLTIIVGTGDGAFAKKTARRAGHLIILSYARCMPGGILAAGIDSHTISSHISLTLRICLVLGT